MCKNITQEELGVRVCLRVCAVEDLPTAHSDHV